MNYTIETGSEALICVQIFVKIDMSHLKANKRRYAGSHTHTDRKMISCIFLFFFQNRDSRLK
jgi:hypothetical protein